MPRAAVTTDSEVRLTHAGGDQAAGAATQCGHRDVRGCRRGSSFDSPLKGTRPAVVLLTSSLPHEMQLRAGGRTVRGAWAPEGTARAGLPLLERNSPFCCSPPLVSTHTPCYTAWNLQEPSSFFQLGPRGRMKSYKEWCEGLFPESQQGWDAAGTEWRIPAHYLGG